MDRTVMMTLTSEYALRAMIYLAQHDDAWPLSGNRIAAETGASRKYLSKILADLVRARVLVASRGKSGGFRLARSPEQIRVADVLAPFEPVLGNRRPCPFGNPVCNDDEPCPGHYPQQPRIGQRLPVRKLHAFEVDDEKQREQDRGDGQKHPEADVRFGEGERLPFVKVVDRDLFRRPGLFHELME